MVADNATFRHARLNAEGREAVALSTLSVKLGAQRRRSRP